MGGTLVFSGATDLLLCNYTQRRKPKFTVVKVVYLAEFTFLFSGLAHSAVLLKQIKKTNLLMSC